MKKFFKQVHNSGIARINLYKKYPESLKLVHLLPMVFTVGACCLLLAVLVGWVGSVWIFQMTHRYVYAVEMPGLMQHAAVFYALSWIPLLPLLLFALLICTDATVANRSLKSACRPWGFFCPTDGLRYGIPPCMVAAVRAR